MKFDYLNQLFSDEDFEEIFKDFEFKLLDDPEFKEDAVREEIIFPILKRLRYSASGTNKIIRSKALKHPFYYFGTKKYNVNIIPDYTFQIDGVNKWVLDAKRPTENILKDKNVFQAYSYAMHPEIQSEIYCLCNGRKLAVFNVKNHKPLLYFDIQELGKYWKQLVKYLDPEIVAKPHLRDFSFDLGLFLMKTGYSTAILEPIEFRIEDINDIVKIEDNLFSINEVFVVPGIEGQQFMGAFDFNKIQYEQLLKILPKSLRTEIENRLKSQPFRYSEINPPKNPIRVIATVGRTINTNKNESYLPFDVLEFKQ